MRRIGTISSALGFIFLGVWMIIEKSNAELGDAFFKWWPMIIIVLGVEVLISFSREKQDTKKVGFNGLVIFVIVMFMLVNTFQGFFNFFGVFNGNNFSFSLDKFIKYGFEFDIENYKEISTSKSVETNGNAFEFRVDNAIIGIHKSTDKKIKVDAKVYVEKDSSVNNYDLKFNENSDGYTVEVDEEYVKKVQADIYIPDGFKLMLDTQSSSIKSYDKLEAASYEISTQSSSVDLNGGKALKLDINSGIMKVNNIKDVRIDGNSGTINIDGNAEIVQASLDSGTFSLDNDLCKNIDIDMSSGTININTKDKNIEVDTDLNSGVSTINGDRRTNSGFSKTIGTGQGKVKVSLNSGTIKVSSQE